MYCVKFKSPEKLNRRIVSDPVKNLTSSAFQRVYTHSFLFSCNPTFFPSLRFYYSIPCFIPRFIITSYRVGSWRVESRRQTRMWVCFLFFFRPSEQKKIWNVTTRRILHEFFIYYIRSRALFNICSFSQPMNDRIFQL